MNYDTCTLTIDWNRLVQDITDIDGTNKREMNWNLPHAVYKRETPMDDIGSIGNPQAMIDEDVFIYEDNYVTYDTVYYYRLSEMRPGGEFFTDQVKLQVKLHILKYEAPYLANIDYNEGERDGVGNLIRYDVFNLDEVDDSGNPVQILKPEWFWEGIGRISEWLEFIVNDVTIDIRMRGTFNRNLKTITLAEDRRNYPAGMVGKTPIMSSSIALGANNLVQTPYWWAEWHKEVVPTDPESWHNFWLSRMGVWDDTADWYDKDWATREETVNYPDRPHNHMYDTSYVEPYEPTIRDLVIRANIGTELTDGQFTGEYYDMDTGSMESGTILGIPRPGNQAGVGLGATLTFKNVRRGIKDGASISFRYEGDLYVITITGIPTYTSNDEADKSRLETLFNGAIGTVPANADELFITVSFGPNFHIL